MHAGVSQSRDNNIRLSSRLELAELIFYVATVNYHLWGVTFLSVMFTKIIQREAQNVRNATNADGLTHGINLKSHT